MKKIFRMVSIFMATLILISGSLIGNENGVFLDYSGKSKPYIGFWEKSKSMY